MPYKYFKFLFITISSAVLLLFFTGTAVSGTVYQGNTGSFIVKDYGTGIISTLFHKNKYMSIEYDLVTKDLPDVVEPEGVSRIHIPHFDSVKLKELEISYFPKMDEIYKKHFDEINRKMDECQAKISEILTTTLKKSRKEMTPNEKYEEKLKWNNIDKLLDELTVKYHQESEDCAAEIYAICRNLQNEELYKTTEAESAELKVELLRAKEIGKGIFKLTWSIARAAYGDLESLLTIIDNTKNLFELMKKMNVNNLDRYYDMYMELEVAVNILNRSFDEARISLNIKRVEKLHDEFIESRKKLGNIDLKKTLIDMEQNISLATDGIEKYKEENDVQIDKLKELKRKVDKFKMIMEWNKDFFINMQQALDGYDTLLDNTNNTIMLKKNELNLLISFKRGGRSDRKSAFAAFINTGYEVVKDIFNVLMELENVREDSR